jgi:hypothetical protein
VLAEHLLEVVVSGGAGSEPAGETPMPTYFADREPPSVRSHVAAMSNRLVP